MSSEARPDSGAHSSIEGWSERKQIILAAGMVTAAVTVAALYFASEVLIPITLAALLTFILAPFANLLRRIGIPRIPAIIFTVLITLGIIVGVGALIGTQVADLATQLPNYRGTLESKVANLRDTALAPISRAISRFDTQSEKPQSSATENDGTPDSDSGPKPVPVIVQQPPLSPVQVGEKVLTPILHPAATVVIMLVVTIFALLYREDIRDRAIRVFGSGDLSRTTSAMDEAGHRLSRYFITQLALNSAFGVVIAIGTYFIGLPHPMLWGVVAGVLRFVPYIGAWIAAALPTLVAAAVEPGWSTALLTLGLFVVTEFLAGQFLEPLLYGHSTGLSPIAVVVAAIFWTWLWGPIGLIISTPLTLCAVVLGRHIEPLSFIEVLLGSRPALRPSESLYQRLLAGDTDEAQEQFEELSEEHGIVDYFDNVAIEALQIATSDFRARKLSHPDAAELRAKFEELIEFAEEINDKENGDPDSVGTAPAHVSSIQILSLPGRGPFDGLAAATLSHLIAREGIDASTSIEEASSRQKLSSLEIKDIALVCVLYLDVRGVPANARLLIRRLRQRNPGAKIVFGLIRKSAPEFQEKIAKLGADEYVSSLKEILDIARALVKKTTELSVPANLSVSPPDSESKKGILPEPTAAL